MTDLTLRLVTTASAEVTPAKPDATPVVATEKENEK